MKNKENARYGVGTPRRAAETAAYSRAAASGSQCITSAAAVQAVHITSLLLRGQENAITLRDLAAVTGLDGRCIRRMIERERRSGTLILSDNQNGYFLASDSEEAQRFVHSMKSRAREILRTALAIEEAARAVDAAEV